MAKVYLHAYINTCIQTFSGSILKMFIELTIILVSECSCLGNGSNPGGSKLHLHYPGYQSHSGYTLIWNGIKKGVSV